MGFLIVVIRSGLQRTFRCMRHADAGGVDVCTKLAAVNSFSLFIFFNVDVFQLDVFTIKVVEILIRCN